MKVNIRNAPGANAVAPKGAGRHNAFSSAEIMAGYDDLDQKLRKLVDQAPLSISTIDVLKVQQQHGVEA